MNRRVIIAGVTLTTLLGSTAFVFVTTIGEKNVRIIHAPRLADENIGLTIPCVRPSRTKGLRLAREALNPSGKIVYHNYGHGGSGWSLGPGSCMQTVDAFESTENVPKDTPLTVLGAGVIGLFTAVLLLSRGYRNVTIVHDNYDATDLPSYKAAGLIALFALQNGEVPRETLEDAAVRTFELYEKTRLKGPHTDIGLIVPRTAVRRIPLYCGGKDECKDCSVFIDKGLMRPMKDVTVACGGQLGPRRKLVVIDDAMFIEVGTWMESLLEALSHRPDAIRWDQRHVTNVENDIHTKYVFNCCGLGAKEAVHDDCVVGIGGHLVTLENQPRPLDYMIDVNLGTFSDSKGRKIVRSLYMTPKNSTHGEALLGGTQVFGTTPSEPFDVLEFPRIVADARKFFNTHDYAESKKK